jgi:hypothetical protein
MSALHVAAAKGHAPVIALLRQVDANVEVRDSRGLTPLHVAVLMGQVEAARALVQAGARIHARQPALNVRPSAGSRAGDSGVEEEEEQVPAHYIAPGGLEGRARTPLEWAQLLGDEAMVAVLTGGGMGAGDGGGEEVRSEEEDTTHESEVLVGRLKRGERKRLEELVTSYAHRAVTDNVKAHQVAVWVPMSTDSED